MMMLAHVGRAFFAIVVGASCSSEFVGDHVVSTSAGPPARIDILLPSGMTLDEVQEYPGGMWVVGAFTPTRYVVLLTKNGVVVDSKGVQAGVEMRALCTDESGRAAIAVVSTSCALDAEVSSIDAWWIDGERLKSRSSVKCICHGREYKSKQ
ncbi:MAG TPA: hypothetical protein VGG74_12635 [Kofleriaceae bacterium]|jgi:hypothetical protein